MNEDDLKFADYFIDCLLKAYPKAICPSYKKYSNAYNAIQELRDKDIIERKGINYKISSIYIDELREYGSYSGWLLRESIKYHSPTANKIPTPNPINKNVNWGKRSVIVAVIAIIVSIILTLF